MHARSFIIDTEYFLIIILHLLVLRTINDDQIIFGHCSKNYFCVSDFNANVNARAPPVTIPIIVTTKVILSAVPCV